jgi:hypothetical protein
VRSANAGMSSVKADAKSAHRQPEGSYGRVIRVGLGGPKPRPQGVGDGQPVSIPAPPVCVEASRTPSGTLRVPIGHGTFRGCGSGNREKGQGEAATSVKATEAGLSGREKPLGEHAGARTANRHWWVGASAPRWAREPSSRNSAISPRNFGRRGPAACDHPRGASTLAGAVSRPRRLFNKNTGLREPERGSMGADACPVPEG